MVSIKHPPLALFKISFQIKNLDNLTFSKIAEMESVLSSSFDIFPNVNVLKKSGPVINLPLGISPIKYLSSKRDKELHIYSDSFDFYFHKYDRWSIIRDEITSILEELNKILQFEIINSFQMEYIDRINIPRTDFEINEYFTLYQISPDQWSLNYEDFYLAINIKTTESDKFIIRLRGISPLQPDSFTFQIETNYNKIDSNKVVPLNLFKEKLNKSHELIISYFTGLLTDKMKSILGVEDDE